MAVHAAKPPNRPGDAPLRSPGSRAGASVPARVADIDKPSAAVGTAVRHGARQRAGKMKHLEALTDAELVQRCRQGSEVAWRALVVRFQRLIYTVPRRAGLGEDAAADVFQLTFSRLYEHLDRIEQPDRVQAWLVTTARFETLRLLREGARQVSLAPATPGDGDVDGHDVDPMELIADDAALPEEQLSDLQQQHRVRRAVAQLDERSQALVELLFLQEEPLPYSEIARRLGIAEGSIGPTRARVLAKLRAVMGSR